MKSSSWAASAPSAASTSTPSVPRDKNGNVVGGNKSIYFNLEYAIPLTQQFSFVFFYDVGNTYDVGMPIKLKDVYSSTGVELKIFVPMLNVPFRLIFAYNPRRAEFRRSAFRLQVRRWTVILLSIQ